jgi:hypothetical protein
MRLISWTHPRGSETIIYQFLPLDKISSQKFFNICSRLAATNIYLNRVVTKLWVDKILQHFLIVFCEICLRNLLHFFEAKFGSYWGNFVFLPNLAKIFSRMSYQFFRSPSKCFHRSAATGRLHKRCMKVSLLGLAMPETVYCADLFTLDQIGRPLC